MEGEEEAMGEMENNPHPRSLENAAPIAQNARLSPPVQPENDMMLFMRQLMAQIKMSSDAMSRKMDENNRKMDENNRKMDVKGEENNSRMEAMSRKMDENSRKMDKTAEKLT